MRPESERVLTADLETGEGHDCNTPDAVTCG